MAVFNSKERRKKLAVMVHILQNTQDFVISHCCFTEEAKEMYNDSKGTYRTMFIKPFFGDILIGVNHRCLLKLPIIESLAKLYSLPISQTLNNILVKSNGFSLIHVLTIAKIPCKQSHNQTCVNQSLMVTHHKWRKYSCFYTSAFLN